MGQIGCREKEVELAPMKLLLSLNTETNEATKHLSIVIRLLKHRPVEADYWRGMINRIESENKRISRVLAIEVADREVREKK